MKIDIIFLSNTVNIEQYGNTQRAINTLRMSQSGHQTVCIDFNIIIVESNSKYQNEGFWYHDCTVISKDEEFNYNKFLNYGLEECKNDWIIIANNDVIFTQNWFSKIIDFDNENPGYGMFCPYEPNWHKAKEKLSAQTGQIIDGKKDFYEGYRTSFEITGWCLVLKRETIDKCELFDERFKFWYQDNDLSLTLQDKNIKNALITNSKVYHMVSQSYSTIPDGKKRDMMEDQIKTFHKKWNK
jgi:hypothetical protein